MNAEKKKKLLVGVTGASGAIYAETLLEKLSLLEAQLERVEIIISEAGARVWEYELGNDNYKKLPFTRYENRDLFAPPASGSSGYDGMIICPCSMGTLGRLASGAAENLLLRAADVMLKERRKLLLVIREAPLGLIHIRNMETLTLAGAVIFPASPGFYFPVQDVKGLAGQFIDRLLETAGFEVPGACHWNPSS